MYQFPFVYHRTVRFQDTDAAGVVYFANVLSMCHEAYEAGLVAAGVKLQEFFSGNPVAIPIVHANVDFLRPMFCGEQYAIHLTPTVVTDTKFQLSYTLFPIDDSLANRPTLDKPSAQATTVHVCIDRQSRRRAPLPRAIGQWLQEKHEKQAAKDKG
ncbi:acyl-CoA thioesterase [Thermocoleostomius sinensis]|uniref:1,4-dihydroxy-2-naphthoyl-CoA hydrolase n=1 Tax=Thermocoleostomius sinensis A174 TaxID=2016057 RepID=A0A9E8ZHJ0_9CYAN|nr:thioesterase family protein [Thermocoleostomius sinensis]WAL61320.1 thioesterase family protein [Thermocoleostomius sinensis A174]